MPCHPARARKLLGRGRAAVLRRYPFTIILRERVGGATQPVRLKVDPGSKATGVVLVNEQTNGTVWAAEVEHRGERIKQALLDRRVLRRGRRARKTRYRKPRFDNRERPEGWLAPSLNSRVQNVLTWVSRLRRLAPVSTLSMELVRFDTQLMQNPEIGGVEYQQGELAGYEVREYLLEKWERRCVYCGKTGVPLQVEHIVPRDRGGGNRVSNLTLACEPCNKKKGNQTAAEFGHPKVQAQARHPLRGAAAVNTTRWALWRALNELGLPLETGTGGRTKYNRARNGYPKGHWIDAAAVGVSGEAVRLGLGHRPLLVKANGWGRRQMCATDKYGFPKQHRTRVKSHFGFQTGDMVHAEVPSGKYAGVHIGRVVVRPRGDFDLKELTSGERFTVNNKHCQPLHRADGYSYATGEPLVAASGEHGTCKAATEDA